MRRISTKIALPLLLGLASAVAVACGEDNTNPDGGEGGSGGGSSDIGDGGGEPNTGGGHTDGAGGGDTDGAGGSNTDGAGGGDAEGGNGGEGNSGGTGGVIVVPPGDPNDLPDCPDEPNETVSGGPIDGEDCWDFTVCEGTDTPQYLNQCSGTCVEPFDNFQRIDGFTGTLPNL